MESAVAGMLYFAAWYLH